MKLKKNLNRLLLQSYHRDKEKRQLRIYVRRDTARRFHENQVVNHDYVSGAETMNAPPTKRETSYGIGFQPINIKFMFFANNRLKPYAQVGAGILVVNKAVPVPRSTLFNLPPISAAV